MTSARTRAAGALLTAGLLCGGTAACQSGASDASGNASAKPTPVALTPVAAVREVASVTGKVTSMRYTMSGSFGTQKDFKADVSLKMDPLAMNMTMTSTQLGGKKVDIEVVGNTVYMDAGEQAAAALGGKRWTKIDLDELAKVTGGGESNALASLGRQSNENPSVGVALLVRSGDVKEAGQGTIDGVRATHYVGTVQVDDLLKHSSELVGQKAVQVAMAEYQKLGVKKLTVDLWAGPGGRMVQVRERASSSMGPIDFAMHVTAVNVPVTVTPPPASQTADLMQLMKQARQG